MPEPLPTFRLSLLYFMEIHIMEATRNLNVIKALEKKEMSAELVKKTLKGSELLLIDWQKEFKVTPEQLFTITVAKVEEIVLDDDASPMPPESQISDNLIRAVEKSEEDYKKGNFTRHDNLDDFFKHINRL